MSEREREAYSSCRGRFAGPPSPTPSRKGRGSILESRRADTCLARVHSSRLGNPIEPPKDVHWVLQRRSIPAPQSAGLDQLYPNVVH